MLNIFKKISDYRKYIQWYIAVLCVIYIIYYLVNNREDLRSLYKINIYDLSLIIIIYFIAFLIQGFRYRIVINKCSGKRIPFFGWFKIFIKGIFLSKLMPQLGNVYRSAVLKKSYNISYTSYISSFASFAWLDSLLSLFIALLLIILFNPHLSFGYIKGYLLILVLFIILIILPYFMYLLLSHIKIKGKFFNWFHLKISEVFKTAVNNTRDYKYIISLFLTGLLSMFSSILIFYICFDGLGIDVALPVLALFGALLKISNLVVLTPGNLGIREIAYGFLGSFAGISPGHTYLASLITRLIGTLLVFALGIGFGGMGVLRKARVSSEDKKESSETFQK